MIINISGDISLMDANDAASYVQELTGEDANIIFGAMYDDSVADYARITVIATGLTDNNLQKHPFGNRASTFCTESQEAGPSPASSRNLNMPSFSLPTMNGPHRERSDKHCSEEGYPDSGFLKKQIIK